MNDDDIIEIIFVATYWPLRVIAMDFKIGHVFGRLAVEPNTTRFTETAIKQFINTMLTEGQ